MFILLPPSETKRPGGGGLSLANAGLEATLSFTEQTTQRRLLLDALTQLAADEVESARVLKLGPKQRGETAVNAGVWLTQTMPAIERFTGVLYDAIDWGGLTSRARQFLHDHVLIQSALFGLIRARDEIPAYRMSFDTRIPNVGPLHKVWSAVGTSVIESLLTDHDTAPILDLRSEGYAALSPLPEHERTFFVRAVGRATDGTLRQLNHFNKKGKGVFVNRLASTFPAWSESQALVSGNPSRTSGTTVHDILRWANDVGIELTRVGSEQTLQLVINEADYPPISAR